MAVTKTQKEESTGHIEETNRDEEAKGRRERRTWKERDERTTIER